MASIENKKFDEFDELDIESLEKKYRNFYGPAFEIKINGQDALRNNMEIPNITVTNPQEGADQFSFSVTNAFDIVKRDFRWMDDFLAMGKTVEISMGYQDKLEPLMFGKITEVSVSFPAGGLPQVEVTGMDISFVMTQNNEPYSKADLKDSDVVEELVKKYGIPEKQIEDTKIKYPKIQKENQSDHMFLSALARKNDFEFFVYGKTLYFRPKSKNRKAPVVTLEWGAGLLSFSPRVNINGQATKVQNKSWDPVTKKAIKGEAQDVEKVGEGGAKTGPQLVKDVFGCEIIHYEHSPASSQEEANLLAKSALSRKAGGLVVGNGETFGIPELRAGRHITLKGLGKVFSKSYLIDSSTHTISSSGYKTNFTVRSNNI